MTDTLGWHKLKEIEDERMTPQQIAALNAEVELIRERARREYQMELYEENNRVLSRTRVRT